MRIKLLNTVILLCIALTLKAQSFTHGSPNIWLLDITRIEINSHLSFTNEIHERTSNYFNQQAQFLLRPSLDYHINKQIEFSLGYSYIHVWPYTPYSLQISKTENNIWEQVFFKFESGRLKIQNRLRQENRWSQHVEHTDHYFVNGTDYSNRFRYRFILNFKILNLNESKNIFLNVWDEYWFLQDRYLRPIDFTRNWFYFGFGLSMNKNTSLQLGYLNQIDKINSDRFIQTDVIQLTFQKNISLIKD